MASEDRIGEVLLGKLEIVRVLGGGGMGVVYEVEHRLTGHRRALKLVHAKFANRPRFMKRLLREAKVAGKLKTPYVVETFDAGRLEDGSAYVLMELLHGRSLYETMQAEGRIDAKRVTRIVAQVAEGIAVAHEAGIVHRDLKPENIFLEKDDNGDDRVKILDFGVSKFSTAPEEAAGRLTIEGTLVGTPYYMSPEQAAGREVDARTDVYALGVIMYEALSGRLPFEAETVGALLVKIGAGECVPLKIRRPDLDPSLVDLVHRAFARDLDTRFESAESLRRELLPFLGGGATAARARTISDGAPLAADKVDSLPGPPRASEETAPPPEGQAVSAPPARGRIPPWTWAVGGAIAAAALVVPWALAPRAATPPTPTIAAPAPAAPLEPMIPTGPRAEEPIAADAGAAIAQAPPPPAVVEQTPVRRPPHNNPHTKAGLDPNPYRPQ